MESTIIAVFCYKRAAKLKESMEALLKNPECASMEVIFFCDGHKGNQDEAGVKATRAYIDSLTGFKKVHTHFRERNISTGPNFHQGISYLCANYDRFIVVEDDLVVAPNYIKYLLDGLDHYRNESSVFCITGFCFPLQKNGYEYDTVMHRRFCSYGWASWSDRVRTVVWDKKELSRIMTGMPGFTSRLNREGMDLSRMLKKQIRGAISTWDIQMQVHVALHDMKVVYPVLSKTHNIGFDQESTNTFGIDYLKTIVDDGTQRSFRFCDAGMVSGGLQKQLKKPYSFRALATRKILNTMIQVGNNLKKAVRPALAPSLPK
jgi:hypothetical protein